MIPILIPSSNRADHVLTNITGQIIVVPEDQLQDYQRFNKCEIVPCPIKGLPATRQWIYEKYGDCFMLDDDVIGMERVYRKTDQKMTPEEAAERIEITYLTAKEIGAFLFGFSEDPNPNHYNPYKPIMLTGMVMGYGLGMIKSESLYFSNEIKLADDYWINCLNMISHRYAFIDTRFALRLKGESTFKRDGGLSTQRTMETEKRDTLLLRKTFGEVVTLKISNRKGAKQDHKYQRKLKFKW